MTSAENQLIEKQSDFRLYLRRELDQKCKGNPQYSLRAFAKALSMDPSLLSKLMNGKRKMTDEHIKNIGLKLGLHIKAIERFLNKKHAQDYYQISLDHFDIISQWQHYALLELMTVKGFKPDTKWLSKKLGITPTEVSSCVERLVRVDLLKIDNGIWVDLSDGKSTHILDKNFTSQAHKQSQIEILKKAIEAVQQKPIEVRDQSSIMMATNQNKIDAAKEKIKVFRRELTEFLEDTDDKTAVYQMSLSLFPLTELESINKETT